MDSTPRQYTRSASTHWITETRKIQAPPPGPSQHSGEAAASALRQKARTGWLRLPRVDGRRRREALTLRITYRGGPEAWFCVEARGEKAYRPGHVFLIDLMREIYGDVGPDDHAPWKITHEAVGRSRRRAQQDIAGHAAKRHPSQSSNVDRPVDEQALAKKRRRS